jgi:hypothetical protein
LSPTDIEIVRLIDASTWHFHVQVNQSNVLAEMRTMLNVDIVDVHRLANVDRDSTFQMIDVDFYSAVEV